MKKVNLLLITITCLVLTSTFASAAPINMVENVFDDFFFLGDFHTYDYASKVDFYRWCQDGWWGGVWIGTSPNLPHYLDWAHTLPEGLNVPPDHIDRAKLWIDGAFIDSRNNVVEIEGTVDWNPLNHRWFDNTTYWLTIVNQPGFWNDGDINVRVTAGECSLRLDESILMLDYTPVPEPGTLILLGGGLLALGAFRFRRKK